MSRTVRTALAQTFPTLLTLPILALLAALDWLPWSVLLAVPLALAVQVAVTLLRTGSGSEG